MNRAAALLLSTVLLGAALTAAAAPDGTDETRQVVRHHLEMINGTDLNALLADYSPDVTLISAQGIAHGTDAVRKLFARITQAGPRPTFALQKEFYAGHIGYLTWTQDAGKPDAIQGSDTFEVRNGKITLQTVAIVAMHPVRRN